MFLKLFTHQINKMPEYFKVRMGDTGPITKIWEKQFYNLKRFIIFRAVKSKNSKCYKNVRMVFLLLHTPLWNRIFLSLSSNSQI